MNNLDRFKPKMKEQFDAFPDGNNRYQFRSSEVTAVLKGKNIRDVFDLLLPLLDGQNSIDEITNRLAGAIGVGQTRDIIRRLIEAGFVEDVGKTLDSGFTPDELQRYRRQLTFFDLATESGGGLEYHKKLREGRLVVLGESDLVVRIARECSWMGVGRIDGVILSGEAPPLSTREFNSDAKLEFHSAPAYDEQSLSRHLLGPRPHLIIAATERPEPELLKSVNEISQKSETPLLHCRVHGVEAIVGPLVIPKLTACLQCWDLSLKRNYDYYHDYLAWERWATSDNKNQRSRGGRLSPFIEMIAGMVVVEAGKQLSAFYEPATYGSFITVNALTFEVMPHEVLKLPRCPACRSDAGKYSFSVWRESQATAAA
jgi:bacteriocin biosynthesis cyclodehydratase domain-containing protein